MIPNSIIRVDPVTGARVIILPLHVLRRMPAILYSSLQAVLDWCNTNSIRTLEEEAEDEVAKLIKWKGNSNATGK